jgi:hypothetical protein
MLSLKDRRSSRIEEAPEAPAAPRLPEVVIGTIVRVAEGGAPEVDFPTNPAGRPVAALATAAITTDDAGRDAALVFIDGDSARPLVLGLIRRPPPPNADAIAEVPAEATPLALDVRLDGERVALTAREQIELKCGKASIILTRAGKVLIRGAYLLSRSSGVNRIKGGSVQLN